MICILHGYLLEGSGSNLWTRSIIRSLCRNGETVHLVCQENHPEMYDFISDFFIYHQDGIVEKRFERKIPYTGNCLLHKPLLGNILPVYVWDNYEEFEYAVPMIDLPDTAISEYLEINYRALKQIIQNHTIKVIHANHTVLMPVVAQRAATEFSLPFTIMPHGSAIEYAVRKDDRFFNFAYDALVKTNLVYVIGNEIRGRMNTLFSSIKELDQKMIDLNLGVDTSLFQPIERDKRKENVEKMCRVLPESSSGRTPEMSERLVTSLRNNIKNEELIKLINESSDYNAKDFDIDIKKRLWKIDWENDSLILFVGRLIASKGIQSVIAALPLIIKEHPDTKLLVVGHGPLREILEIILWALEKGAINLIQSIINWGGDLKDTRPNPFLEIKYFFEKLAKNKKLEIYFKLAQKYIQSDTVIFTGYLTHNELRYLFPACDVSIFPSVVPEAGPLVFLESLASGCFPVGTYFAGMAASIDSVKGSLPDQVLQLMKLSPNPKETIPNMVDKVVGVLNLNGRYKYDLQKVATSRYDWKNISKSFADELKQLCPDNN